MPGANLGVAMNLKTSSSRACCMPAYLGVAMNLDYLVIAYMDSSANAGSAITIRLPLGKD
jgi:hypothetical protein